MNTFVPEGSDYYKGAMALDTRRLGCQLKEVQQMHEALVTGAPAHILHHPATQMWLGHEDGLLEYGNACYGAYLTRTGRRTHASGSYILMRLPAEPAGRYPDWVEPLAKLHKCKLFRKDTIHYAQYQEYCYYFSFPRYPVTLDGKTIEWVNYDEKRRCWFLDSAVDGKYKTAWAAIQHVRAHHT